MYAIRSYYALPVLLAVAWAGLDGGPSGEARKELPGEVRPGERLDAEIAFDWPERPGRYRRITSYNVCYTKLLRWRSAHRGAT